jgi:hypothetical protein
MFKVQAQFKSTTAKYILVGLELPPCQRSPRQGREAELSPLQGAQKRPCSGGVSFKYSENRTTPPPSPLRDSGNAHRASRHLGRRDHAPLHLHRVFYHDGTLSAGLLPGVRG